MSQPFVGEVRGFGFNFAPRGWMICSGQVLPIAQYSPLFAIIGTQYGGNGQTTFALPNLCGRVVLSQGQGPGLSNYVVGEQTGTENYTLLITEMPSHSHAPFTKTQATTANKHLTPVAGDYLTRFNPAVNQIGSTWNTPPLENMVTLNPSFVGVAGGSLPHENRQPYLPILYCIAIAGIFPARN